MKCRKCKIEDASSKEHLIANSRLSQINSFKTINEKNDNIPKTYKKITCENCNNLMGRYEEKRWSNLAYATAWKILAGNYNSAFEQYPDFIIKNTPKEIIEKYESELLMLINGDGFLPENTFTFSFDPNLSDLKKKFGFASVQCIIKLLDQDGNIIHGASVYSKDNGGGEKEVGYQATTDKYGMAKIDVLTRVEIVRVITEDLILTNINSGEKKNAIIDIVVYISFNSNSHRLVFIFPLLAKYQTNWEDGTKINVSHKGFLNILQNNFPEIAFTEIEEYYKTTPNNVYK
jgi:hypothetical protein